MDPTTQAASAAGATPSLSEHDKRLLLASWTMDFTEMSNLLMATFITFGDRYPHLTRVLEVEHLLRAPRETWMVDDQFRMRTLRMAQVCGE